MDLTTLANVKAWLNLTVDISDALLVRLIAGISAWVQSYLSRQVLSQSYAEVRDGHDTQVLYFREYPVTAVSGVTVDGVAIPPAPDTVTPVYRFTLGRLILQGYRFTRGWGNVTLDYTAGYDAAPPDLEQAVIELVAFRFKERGHIGDQSVAFQGQTTSFTVAELPPSVKAVLDKWKKVVPG
jgi:uncharacterized phiE125 gp8 family phage protein